MTVVTVSATVGLNLTKCQWHDMWFKNNSLLLFSWWYTGLNLVSVHGYGCHSLPTWYGFSWPVTTEVGAGQLSQGWRWTRLLFPGLPMLNPRWIINDGFWHRPRIHLNQRKLILTESDNFQNQPESGLRGCSCIWMCALFLLPLC